MEVGFMKANLGKGVEVPHHKRTEDSPTERLPIPASVTIPVTQHIGAPAELVVKKGDKVYVGTTIGKATGFVSVDTHASISGVVKSIDEVQFPDGSRRAAVVIEGDGEQTPDPELTPPVVASRDDLVKAVQKSGLVGLGGAGFPTHVKLAKIDKPVDLLLLNGAECEPYITSDYRTMMEDTDALLAGVKTLLKWLEIPRAVIAIEKNKPKAIELLSERTKGDSNIEIRGLKCSYPQGAEKVLISTVTGRAVPAGKLPADAGVVIMNVTTVAVLQKYLETGMPLVEKRLTVDGDGASRRGNYFVPIGISAEELLGEIKEDCDRILMGGPMMGLANPSAVFPVLKYNNAILALARSQTVDIPNDPCIRCGRCVDGCPMRLSPVEIDSAYELQQVDQLKALFVMDCIECGCCSFSCPAGRPLTQTMRLAKAAVRKAGAK